MKRCIALLVSMILLASMLSGCLQSTDPNVETLPTKTAPTTTAAPQTQPTTVPTQPTTIPTQPEDPGVELESQTECTLHCTYSEAEKVEWPVVIKSSAELLEFANSDAGKVFFDASDIADVYAHFNDAFFEEHTLILVAIYIETGHNQILDVYSAVKKDGCYYFSIAMSRGPVVGPAFHESAVWLIEVKDDMPKNATIYFELQSNLELIS